MPTRSRSGGAKVAHDPFAGEWTQNLGKTRLRQGLVLKIEPDGNDGIRFLDYFSYTAQFDGKQYDLKTPATIPCNFNLSMLTLWIRYTGETIK